ncbi:hypothetical protein DACRYDRAFT_112967 [Dacryopinax primogenitus]|uniref:Bromo domain-containing protein n=1 Tax=Dacryopinax primogenitus (strain DJM 731) TaxID=1858805 RepID=M5GCI0_DACPD|nr:uncharacterized protein DACRYDRAFT_112967 [Dacryopinax primogenitus]EJU06220.1 hypothetical protein DACRYDRAFT_112967 [Dacryopinax primogenitus]
MPRFTRSRKIRRLRVWSPAPATSASFMHVTLAMTTDPHLREQYDQLSLRERLLISQAVYELGVGDLNAVAKLVRDHPLVNRPEFFTPEACGTYYAQLMVDLGEDTADVKNPVTAVHAPIHLKLARKLWTARVAELRTQIHQKEEDFHRLFQEIEDIRAGKWDERIVSELREKGKLTAAGDDELAAEKEDAQEQPEVQLDTMVKEHDEEPEAAVEEPVVHLEEDVEMADMTAEEAAEEFAEAEAEAEPEREAEPEAETEAEADVEAEAETEAPEEPHTAEEVDMGEPEEMPTEEAEPEVEEEAAGLREESSPAEETPLLEASEPEPEPEPEPAEPDHETEPEPEPEPEPSHPRRRGLRSRKSTPAPGLFTVGSPRTRPHDRVSPFHEEDIAVRASHETEQDGSPPNAEEAETGASVADETRSEREKSVKRESTVEMDTEPSLPSQRRSRSGRFSKRKVSESGLGSPVEIELEPPAKRRRKRSESFASTVEKSSPAPVVPLPPQAPMTPGQASANLKRFQAMIGPLLTQIMAHRNGNVFNNPVTESDAPGYRETVRRPMDLKTIKARIRDGQITNSQEFRRDVYLMFANALMFNPPGSDVAKMAREMMKFSDGVIRDFLMTEELVGISI